MTDNSSTAVPPAPAPALAPVPARPPRRGWHWFGRSLLYFFGVALPLAALGVELGTGMCSSILFNPVATWLHGVLIALVPVVNFLLLRVTAGKPAWGLKPEWLDALAGAAIAITGFYTLVFLPIMPFAIMGLAAIIYFGIGLLALLPLSPLAALVCALILRWRARRVAPAAPHRAWAWGALAGCVALLLAWAPDIATRAGVRMAAAPEPESRAAGLRLLRTLGDRDLMLRMCYSLPTSPLEVVPWLRTTRAGEDTLRNVRAVYFLVTGDAYDTVPRPDFGDPFGRARAATEQFDPIQGGTTVGAVLKGLTLTDSRLDGAIAPDAALAYLEWTLVFRNESRSQQREARAEIALPPGAVVSRLTLWINGEEREAAFGGRSQVRAAYEKVVVRRRDPVLVTTAGPDRILLQCFPVPPNGGEMKTRLGITCPLAVEAADQARLALPRFIDRNFGLPADGGTYAAWLESPRPLQGGSAWKAEHPNDQTWALRGRVDPAQPAAAFSMARDPALTLAWAPDAEGDGGFLVQQVLAAQPGVAPSSVVVVVDCSKHITQLPALAAALEKLPAHIPVRALAAGDDVREMLPAESGLDRAQLARAVLELSTVGGCDNVPALTQAWDLAAAIPGSVILWIHGPQPCLLGSVEELRQRFERRPDGPRLVEMAVAGGVNQVLDKLANLPALRAAPLAGAPEDTLLELYRRWDPARTTWQPTRQRVPGAAGPAGAVETSRHLVRLWAADTVRDLLGQLPPQTEEATRLAVSRQIVTPVSGAVVLETQQQYDEAGLKPVPPNSVPTVPEPGELALMAITLLAVLGASWYWRRAQPA